MDNVIVELKNFSKKYGKKEIIKNLNLKVYEGEFLTILGASGCGKTTILRAIAGIDSITSGKIYIDGEDVTFIDATKREVNTIFQNYALFPHMTVEENISFGLKMKKVDKKQIESQVKAMLGLVKLNGYEKRKPQQLSGGEQQRVSIARGLINKPKVLLLDEPISALDLKLKKQMQIELKMLQRKLGITFIYVTHNQDEAMTMSDRIVLLKDGEIEQEGTPEEIYRHPKTKYVADFIGESNIFSGLVKSVKDDKATVILDGKYEVQILNDNYNIDDELYVVFRPEDLIMKTNSQDINKLEVVVKENIYDGSLTKVIANLDNKEIKITVNKGNMVYPVESKVFLTWNIDDTIVIKEKSNERK